MISFQIVHLFCEMQKIKLAKKGLKSGKVQKPFINLFDQILEITSAEDYDPKNPPIEQKELEKKMDKMVYELYG